MSGRQSTHEIASLSSRVLDLATVLAVTIVAYALANVLHEAVGHGGACVAVGGSPIAVSAIHFECDEGGLGASGLRAVAAAGTLVNLVAGALFLGLGRVCASRSPSLRFFLWLSMTLNLLQGTGYLLFSGVGNVGDWAAVVDGLEPRAVYRMTMALAGGAFYVAVIWLALAELGRFLGGEDPERERAARRLTLVPYVAGGLLYVAAGVLNPVSWKLVLLSAVAASFGGASGLAWMADVLKLDRVPKAAGVPRFELPRDHAWIAAAVVIAVVFVGWLGRGVALR